MSDGIHWTDLYQAALLEIDPEKLSGRIEVARMAIREKIDGMPMYSGDRSERQLLIDALRNLEVLRKEVR